jgi:hypothetical protein
MDSSQNQVIPKYSVPFAVLVVTLSLCLFAGSSHAAESGECGTPEEITAKLKAEDQHSFATADRAERKNDLNTLYGIIFTVSSDKATGYILESDKATDQRASRICIRNRLADLRVFDARQPGLKPASLLKAPDSDALRHCDEMVRAGKVNAGTCGPFNSSMQKGEANGERIMFQGFNVERAADGSHKKDGTMTTVTGNLVGSLHDDPNRPLKGVVSAISFSSLPDGATITNAILVYAHYTPYGMALLDH